MDTVVESKAGLKTPAYAAKSAKSPLGPFSIERRTPRPHDVLIDILYCGVCHSDVHQVRDEWGGSIFPMVPGHGKAPGKPRLIREVCSTGQRTGQQAPLAAFRVMAGGLSPKREQVLC